MSFTNNPGRFAGLLYVLTSIVGFFAMGYVPGRLIVHGNAAATANNIATFETLFRLGIAGDLIGHAGFIFVALALYDLLKGVDQRHAQIFFSLYFAMTGMHALHMVIGVGIFSYLLYYASKGRYTPEYHTPLENSGLYWHFVDIIWIYLFPLLYLIDRKK